IGGGNIHKNKVELVGKVTCISDIKTDINNNRFMFFDIVQNEMIDNKIYNSSFYKVRLNNDLITKYKDILVKGNNLYIDGYLHSYKKDTRLIYYIYPKEILKLDKDFNFENEIPMISYDTDGVMLWHGKRCESIPPTEEELKEMEDLLSEFR
ncbi:MAG: single-stranded DNA-binding protein, partial [Bacilli bacterium]|nr:single-stranded DNA-binding protein [Bacilli bacterium]